MAVATRVYPARRRPTTWTEQFGPAAVTIVLATLMTLATVQSVVASNWARGLQVLIGVAFGGLLVGGLFAQVRGLPAWLAHLLSAVLGVAWAINRIGPLLGPALPTWKDQATELLIRVIILSRVLTNGGTGEDLLLFITLLALVSWGLAYATVWMLIRRGWSWGPVILNALVMLVNLTYASPKPPVGLFYVFAGAALLLLVHQNYLMRSRIWSSALIEFPDLLGWRFVASGTFVVLALLSVTALLPTRITSAQVASVWQRVREPWQNVQNRWDKAFSNINAPANASGTVFGGRSLNLSGARSLGNGLVMEVQSSGPDGRPYFDYWRATAYDRYVGTADGAEADARTWSDTTGQIAAATLGLRQEEQARSPLDADAPLSQIDTVDRQTITQTVTLRQSFPQPTLFAATQPISVSIPIRVKHTFLDVDGQSVANYGDMSLFAAQTSSVRSGLSYIVHSSVSVADKQSLRQAPTDYPDWVQRYLQLPEDDGLNRVKAKAEELAGAATNPYDKAEAIQSYLRTFPYDEKIPFPPENRDRVDWFLFDLKRGYCDYFASAMALMLRSQDVPARIVSGYAGGEFNIEKGVFEVRQNVAHTWVEAYFPGYGWQRFEPTPASYTNVPDRPESPASENGEGIDPAELATGPFPNRDIDLEALEQRIAELEGENSNPEQVRALIEANAAAQRRAAWTRGGLIGGGVLALGLAALAFYRRPRGIGPAGMVYSRALWAARWAGLGPKESATPREFALQLAEHMPTQRQSLTEIATAYTHERYSDDKQSRSSNVDAAWQQVRWPLVSTVLARWTGVGRAATRRNKQSNGRVDSLRGTRRETGRKRR